MMNALHGWQRKVGILTLIVALAFTAVWIRSLRYLDDIVIFADTRTIQGIYSTPSKLVWMWARRKNVALGDSIANEPREMRRIFLRPGCWVLMVPSRKKRVHWTTAPINSEVDTGEEPSPTEFDFNEALPDARWYWNVIGSRFGVERTEYHVAVALTVSHWLLVCPLTLLSAYLLIRKPRTTKVCVANSDQVITTG